MPGAGDVWTISTCLRDVGQILAGNQIFTWHVIATSDYGDITDLDAAWQAALPNLMNQLSDGVEAVGAFYTRWLPTPLGTHGIKFPTAIVGGVAAQPLPLASCALVLRQSGLAGRNSWGRLYLPWLPVQYEDPAIPNRLVEVNRLGIEQACYDTNDTLQAGASGSAWSTVTVSRRSAATPGVYATPVTTFTCMNDFRALAQRGRREYQCPFEDRWLAIQFPGSFAKRKSAGGGWSNSGSNPLGWRYWLDNGSRGGDDGAVDPNWVMPTFAGLAWHTLSAFSSPGKRECPATHGPGGITWPYVPRNPDANDPPAYELVDGWHYLVIGGGVPNAGDSWLNAGELDYYRCRWKVTNVPLVRSATLYINQLDGVAHYINGTEVFNNLGAYDAGAPPCRGGLEIDILPLLIYENALNCWGVIHQPQGTLGTSKHYYDRYLDQQPPEQDLYDSWWAGEIRIGGTTE